MKWINLWVKDFADYIYTKLPSNTIPQQIFCTKAKNIRE